jgi:hypothetical protein
MVKRTRGTCLKDVSNRVDVLFCSVSPFVICFTLFYVRMILCTMFTLCFVHFSQFGLKELYHVILNKIKCHCQCHSVVPNPKSEQPRASSYTLPHRSRFLRLQASKMPASDAILTQILAQLETMQVAQQTMQAKVRYLTVV